MSNSIEDLDKRIDHKMEQRMNSRNTEWYYIYGTSQDKKGRSKGFLIGPFSYEKAEGLMKTSKFSSANMVALNTTDLSRAGQILKFRRLHGGESMASIFERVKHKGIAEETTL